MARAFIKLKRRLFLINRGGIPSWGLLFTFALQAMLSGCGPSIPETPYESASPVEHIASEPSATQAFVDDSKAAGFDFVHVNGMTGQYFFVEMMGSGGALFDYDNDGDLDLYAVQGHPLDATSTAPRPLDHLFRNDFLETGTLHFTDVTSSSNLLATGYGMGVTTGDYDGDGFVDLYLVNWGANQLWHNNGDGTFTDVTLKSGTDDPRWSTAAAFLDVDRDGWLDLMVTNYVSYTLKNDHPCYAPSGRRDYCSPGAYSPEPDRLFRNRGDGTFEDVSLAMGLTQAFGPALGVVTADFNLDGWPDIYVTNDGQENQLWINQSGQRFENQALLAGVAVNGAGMAEASMGVTAADFDQDGDQDLFMTHLFGETNTLYVNNGDALFEDRTRAMGLDVSSRIFTSFGIAPLDYDNDGWLDLYIANGEVKIIPEQAEHDEALPLRQTNQLFRNVGQGRFSDVTPTGNTLFDRAEVSRGVAYGDVDNDGDIDVVLFNNNGPAHLLRNEVGQRRPWLGLHLVHKASQQDALGARVELIRLDGSSLWRRVHVDGSYASAHDSRVVFGLGRAAAYDAVRVYWPSGNVEAWTGLAVNRYHRLIEGEGVQVNEGT